MSLITETYLEGLDAYTVTIRHCAAHLVYFSPCRTLGGRGWRPSDTVRASTEARLAPSTPSTPPPHLTRGSANFYSYRHAVTGATRQGCNPDMGARIRLDDDHDLRHARALLGDRKDQLFSPVGRNRERNQLGTFLTIFKNPVFSREFPVLFTY